MDRKFALKVVEGNSSDHPSSSSGTRNATADAAHVSAAVKKNKEQTGRTSIQAPRENPISTSSGSGREPTMAELMAAVTMGNAEVMRMQEKVLAKPKIVESKFDHEGKRNKGCPKIHAAHTQAHSSVTVRTAEVLIRLCKKLPETAEERRKRKMLEQSVKHLKALEAQNHHILCPPDDSSESEDSLESQ